MRTALTHRILGDAESTVATLVGRGLSTEAVAARTGMDQADVRVTLDGVLRKLGEFEPGSIQAYETCVHSTPC